MMSQSESRFFHETSRQRADRFHAASQTRAGADQPGLLIVGAGMMGREHIRIAQRMGRARVIGLYDPSGTSLDSAEQTFGGGLRRYESPKQAARDPAIEAIIVSSPNHTHFDVVRALCDSGKPLLVEKPMATTLADAAQLVRIAADYPSFIQIGMQYRYKCQYVDAFNEVFERDAVGAVHTISVSEYRPPFLDKVEQWNKFNEFSGGTLVEKCCHYFDLINLLADSAPESVYASGGRAVNFLDFEYGGRKSDIDDHAFVIINYRNGIRASFTLNMFSEELHEELIVCGGKGRVIASEQASFKQPGSQARLQLETNEIQELRRPAYPEPIEASGHHGATWFAHEAMLDRMNGHAVDAATPEQGLKALIVATAAQRSMAANKVVFVEELIHREGLTDLTPDWQS